jgi:hypothetical protein
VRAPLFFPGLFGLLYLISGTFRPPEPAIRWRLRPSLAGTSSC